jgi:ABC-type transport system involved in multi-copper enzyme maturation permease subunit
VRFVLGTIVVVAVCGFMTLMRPVIVAQWQRDLVEHPEWQNPLWFNDVLRSYPYYLWHYLYQDMLQKVLVVFAVLLGVGGLAREAQYGTAGFTLSFPVSRSTLLLTRALVSFVQLLMMALIAFAALMTGSAIIGEHYSIAHAALHVSTLIFGATAALAVSMAISTAVEGEHAPMLVGLSAISLLYFSVAPYNDGGPQPPLVRLLNFQGALAGGPGASLSDISFAGLFATALLSVAALCFAIQRSSSRDF